MHDVLTIVMGGGKGTRLYPLTADRAKPAVPFGAKYRLVDIPLSNSIAANFKKIYVLTQFNTASLHLHIGNTYIFDSFTNGFVEVLAAEQTFTHTGWYEGTADAVRKNLVHFRTQKPTHYMILSGDQLYRMDLRGFFDEHIQSGAEASVAVLPVNRKDATGFGILTVDTKKRIKKFTEKPPLEKDITALKIPKTLAARLPNYEEGKDYLASMGIYIFNAETMEAVLDSDEADFGKEILPNMIGSRHVNAYFFNGFWEDIGTIESFYKTSLDLADIYPAFNLYDEDMPIYTRRRDLPPSKLNSCTISHTLAADGCIITESSISRSVIGIRTIIGEGCTLEGVVCMGADYYEEPGPEPLEEGTHVPPIGIGRGTRIRQAIIDKNARIGEGCSIGWDGIPPEGDYERYFVRDGIIIVPKNGVIPAGTVI
ncbi:glucose-1-phosphate adenylyltransferase [Alkalispirochaeta sphaeroplastigenens]|uniref:Glucose-1-phosphate adenylyltransferase n=1 Tax=Alkalispirochaeta sphaeroplastigenens TaxID=1187066 RepID=A0A2S4K097_9SPIO|nr:glucose-1-phosphate adenylyltransferase [Alkalispirochaeta sphaeroplastigenens]POR05190.1 glucose-1-phosphate adenylyltransferase [Alkalispirochaeta sphaeroplastigenens]